MTDSPPVPPPGPPPGPSLDPDPISALVSRARTGDLAAFEELVRRLQRMAIGYCYGVLGDVHLAEDAAQQAFLAAYQALGQLRSPAAFVTWFRLILRKQCDRLTRKARLPIVPLEDAVDIRDDTPGPDVLAERSETRALVRRALLVLPPAERIVTLLFYFSGESQAGIADFLGIDAVTVKNRLRAARARLEERMLTLVEDTLRAQTPAPDFAARVARLLRASARGDLSSVTALLADEPALATAAGPHPFWGGTPQPLQVAAEWGRADVVRALLDAGADPNARGAEYDGWSPLDAALHHDHGPARHAEVVRLLLEAGAEVTIHAAAAMGDADRVRDLLTHDPSQVHAAGPNGWPPLYFASTGDVVSVLLAAAADGRATDEKGRQPLEVIASYGGRRRSAVARLVNHLGELPLAVACAVGNREIVAASLAKDPALARAPVARDAHQLIHVASLHGHVTIVALLLDAGADVDARTADSDGGLTPLHLAARNGHADVASLLLDRGADPTIADGWHDATPAAWAEFQGWPDVARVIKTSRYTPPGNRGPAPARDPSGSSGD